MSYLISLLALSGLLASLAVHLAALSGIDVLTYWPSVWLLHVGIFIVFAPVVFSSRKAFGPKPSLADLRAAFPAWVLAAGMMLSCYAVINFLLFMQSTGGGNPEVRDGKYLLLSHGKLIRELTQAEYASLRANEIRGFSGHWLLFYFVSFTDIAFRRKNVTGAGSSTGVGVLGK